jgi:hypothetical protein
MRLQYSAVCGGVQPQLQEQHVIAETRRLSAISNWAFARVSVITNGNKVEITHSHLLVLAQNLHCSLSRKKPRPRIPLQGKPYISFLYIQLPHLQLVFTML